MVAPRRSARSNKGQHWKREMNLLLEDSDDDSKREPLSDDEYVDNKTKVESDIELDKDLEDKDDDIEDKDEDLEDKDDVIETPRAKRQKISKAKPKETVSLKDKIRANVAKAFVNVLKSQIPDTFTEDNKLKDEVITNWSFRLEAAIFKQFPQKDRHYTDKSRATMTLLKKANVLQRLMDKSLTFEQLVMSSPEEIDEDLKKYADKVRQESIRRSVLVSNEADGQRIRRTHKGEEIVEDVSDAHKQEDEVDIVSKTVDHRRFENEEESSEKLENTEKSSEKEQKVEESTTYYNTAALHSDDYSLDNNENPDLDDDDDLDKILKSDKPEVAAKPAKPSPKPIKSALKSSSAQSTSLPPTSSTSVWEGRITFPEFTTFPASVEYITATNYRVPQTPLDVKLHNNCINVSKEIFSQRFYEIEGRLDRSRADPYLNQVVSSRDFYFFKITATDEQDDYTKLYKYLLLRSKVGVLSGRPLFVKDAYVIALDHEVPAYLSRLANTSNLSGLYALYVVKKDYVLVAQKASDNVTQSRTPLYSKPATKTVPASSQSSVLDSILSKLGGEVQSNATLPKSSNGPNLPPKPNFQAQGLSAAQMGALSSIAQQNPRAQNNPQELARILEQQKHKYGY